MTTRTTTTSGTASLTPSIRNGLLLCVVLGVADALSPLLPTPDGSDGPPVGIIVLATLVGLLTLWLVFRAWRTRSRKLIRGVAGLRILSMVAGLPALFVDIPAWAKVLTAVQVLLTLGALVLLLHREPGLGRVTD